MDKLLFRLGLMQMEIEYCIQLIHIFVRDNKYLYLIIVSKNQLKLWK